MNTDPLVDRRQAALRLLAGAAGLGAGMPWPSAWAQLSSPIPGAQPVQGAQPGSGQGLGYHSPNSPFPQMAPRADTVPWPLLAEVKTRNVKNRLLPDFPPGVLALGRKPQRIQGYMMPLDPGERQRHFLLSAVPLTCAFCVPGGPESLVEVRSREPVRYAMAPLVIEGRFEVLPDDPQGVYYRMSDAVQVK